MCSISLNTGRGVGVGVGATVARVDGAGAVCVCALCAVFSLPNDPTTAVPAFMADTTSDLLIIPFLEVPVCRRREKIEWQYIHTQINNIENTT